MRYAPLIFWMVALCPLNHLVGQAFPDRHTTNAFDSWISCEPSPNPNPARGTSHWIRYDFGQAYSLYDLTLWNLNHPQYVTSGLRNVIIDYSTNGTNWISLDTFTIPKASASGQYEGVQGPDLDGVNARYLLITAVDNYGGGCYGLSEIRIHTQNVSQPEFALAFSPCESEGVYQRLTGGMELGGTYSGRGVSDNGDETFDFDVQKAGPGTHTINYNYSGGSMSADIVVLPCTDPFCMDCVECNVNDIMTVNMNPIPSDVYVGFEVMSNGRVPATHMVEFMGNQSVTLQPGFEVASSGTFLADFRTCVENRVTNGGFENGVADWDLYVNSGAGAAGTVQVDQQSAYEESSSARLQVTNATGTSWHIQYMQAGHTIEAGKTYEVSFYARAANPGGMDFQAHLHSSPYTNYHYEGVTLTPYWTKYTMTFTPDASVANNLRLTFQVGNANNTYWIDKVRFVEKD